MSHIYFNHIPRCGGRFFSRSLIDSEEIKNYFVNNNERINIKKYNDSNFLHGHLGIEPNILFNDLSTIVLLRDPVKRFISHFAFFINRNLKINRDYEATLKFFNDWLFDDELDFFIKDNLMSKFLTNNRIKLSDGGVSLSVSFQRKVLGERLNNIFTGLENKPTNMAKAKKYLENCGLIIFNENFLNEQNKIKNFFKENNINVYNNRINNNNTFYFEKSNEIYKSLNNKQLDKILELCYIDLELYKYAKEIVDNR